ncbi:MAG TPA: glycoside hydrolase N-terminal domain-containing protein [Candidatus Aminicenantes bacterium]|nr:glycoside hydrolase N-terminal domain-containing protein [Candidatus Aminicenantes bacterium]HRY64584.1 glycoside hydrolase N-terminal domain-containing protein [Candidatus Aminicenantes bacterium]HRZ71497.1 glycoside hydrolase N-terminal domain-containing protein [Candidatus Aminicenantes bacterium]
MIRIRRAVFPAALVLTAVLADTVPGPAAAPGPSSPSAAGVSRDLVPPARGFVSSEPGATWEQGLLSGNGTIGASVLGRPLDEIVVFSHKRMFVPERDPLLPPATATRLFEIRRLIDRGLYAQAGQLAVDASIQKEFLYPDALMPAFDLRIRMEAEGDISGYGRATDFATGETIVHWADGRGPFERRLFVSRAHGIAVLKISGPVPGAINCRLELSPREPGNRRFRADVNNLAVTADPSTLTFRHGFVHAYAGSIQGLEGVARVVARGAATSADGQGLAVKGADEVLVFVDIKVLDDFEKSLIEGTKKDLAGLPADYSALLAPHAGIHGGIFGRMRLDLGGGADRGLTSEELLARTTDEEPSRALIEKVFDAGRYNILSSVSDLPPTLQGVWAGTYSPPWASDFTHNGNVPSAIASLLMGNMPELMPAYTSYMEELVPYLEVNAGMIFGARGIVLPSRSTTNGYNNAFEADFPGQFWVAGAAWAAHFFYDYWLYTGDREFLARHALPFMEKAALFFEDFLYEDQNGRYVFSPTQSPENAPSNTRSQMSFNAAMDVAAAKELLSNTIAASRTLGVNRDRIPVWETMLAKMPPYLVNEDGAVKEWLTPLLADNYNHRHSSQLYALYDGMPGEIAKDPGLQAAFKRLIEIKLDRHWSNWRKQGGFMSFGLVQLGQASASLGQAELAYRCLVPLVNRYWLHNLASMHNAKQLFNMDISGGLPAVLIKMLVSSDPGVIRLLPACPAAWPSGTIEGVLCRGRVEARRLTWNGKTIEVALESGRAQEITLIAPGDIAFLAVRGGGASVRSAGNARSRRLSLPAGREVKVEIGLK